jgi:DNA-binding MarR family transcriptional regulator
MMPDIYFTYQVLIKENYMTKISNQLNFLLLLSKTQTIIARKFSGQGLSFGDLAVLYAINQAPEGKIRRVDLAEKVGLTASGVTRLLIPLEKIGIIQREIYERDARVSFAKMTKAGKELFENSIKDAELKCEEFIQKDQNTKIEQATELLNSII